MLQSLCFITCNSAIGTFKITEALFLFFPFVSLVSLLGVQLEIRIPGNMTSCTIPGLEAGVEYNVNVFAVINNSISIPASITISTCECHTSVWNRSVSAMSYKHWLLVGKGEKWNLNTTHRYPHTDTLAISSFHRPLI